MFQRPHRYLGGVIGPGSHPAWLLVKGLAVLLPKVLRLLGAGIQHQRHAGKNSVGEISWGGPLFGEWSEPLSEGQVANGVGTDNGEGQAAALDFHQQFHGLGLLGGDEDQARVLLEQVSNYPQHRRVGFRFPGGKDPASFDSPAQAQKLTLEGGPKPDAVGVLIVVDNADRLMAQDFPGIVGHESALSAHIRNHPKVPGIATGHLLGSGGSGNGWNSRLPVYFPSSDGAGAEVVAQHHQNVAFPGNLLGAPLRRDGGAFVVIDPQRDLTPVYTSLPVGPVQVKLS